MTFKEFVEFKSMLKGNKHINSPAGGFNPNNQNRKHFNLTRKGSKAKHPLVKRIIDQRGSIVRKLSPSEVRSIYTAYNLKYINGVKDVKELNSNSKGNLKIEKDPSGYGRLVKR